VNFWVFLALVALVPLAIRLLPVGPSRYRIIAAVLFVLVLFVAAPWLLESYRLFQLSRIAVWVIVAMGLNILTGYNGQISLGHGAFVLIGAYTSAVLLDNKEQLGFIDSTPWPFWATIIAGGVIGGFTGFVLGFPALRLSGPYLAIATLALVISLPAMIRKYDELTGGSQGLFIPQPPPPPGLEDSITRDEWLYLLMLGVAVVMLLIAWSMLSGPLGRAFIAVRDSEVAATAMGINVARTKVAAFTISAFYAGVAGALLTVLLGVMTPETVDIVTSINFLTAIVIGGLASILGSIIGAIVLVLLPSDAPSIVAMLPLVSEDVVNRAPGAIQGILVIIVALLLPYGVAGAYHRLIGAGPAALWSGLLGLPGALAHRAREIKENIAWAWEDMPWKRQGISPPRPEKERG
jgi:branched-chain amino acid transport system permease protein